MTTFYLDPIGGSDANAGTSFALRWKTIASGATAARIAPGDTIRVIASPEPTLVGDATWTNNSRTLTLAGALTANITDCSSAWTGAANVTATVSTTTYREGTQAANIAIAAGFTTGKVAHFATGTLDLSAYQQVSLMMRSSVAIASGVFELKLCSDTAGDTPVHTFTVGALAAGEYGPMVRDNAAALGSAVASVALYAVSDPGTVTIGLDNIIACKASSSDDALTHKSLLGKVHNLSWVASTAYALNAKRRPTQPNRNGFQYKATTAGTTDGSEPTWPQEIGMTVADGSVVWTCEELEDTWYALASISGTTLKLAADSNITAGSDVNTGSTYQGATETVATYKREGNYDAGALATVQDSGSGAGGFISFVGGWNRTDMTAQTGETWIDGLGSDGTGISASNRTYVHIENINVTRQNIGVNMATGAFVRLKNVHCIANQFNFSSSSGSKVDGQNVVTKNSSTNWSAFSSPSMRLKCFQFDGQPADGIGAGAPYVEIDNMNFRGNGNTSSNGIGPNSSAGSCYMRIRNLVTANNANPPLVGGLGEIELVNPSIGEATPTQNFGNGGEGMIKASRWGGDSNDHRVYTDGGTIMSATDQRHTASGISWKFNPTALTRGEIYPLRLPIARIACATGVTRTVTIWTRRSATAIKGRLVLPGGQIAGTQKTIVECQPTVDTWVESDALTFTPTQDGVVELEFHVWDGAGTTNSYWIDDLAVS